MAEKIYCSKCGHENTKDSSFCVVCGAKLSPLCPKCGLAILPSAQFCPHCGAKLSEGARPLPEQWAGEIAHLSIELPLSKSWGASVEPDGIECFLKTTDKLGNHVITEGTWSAKLWQVDIPFLSTTPKRGKLLAIWEDGELKREHYQPFLLGVAALCRLAYGDFKPKPEQIGDLEVTLTVPNLGQFSAREPWIDLRP